MIKVKRKKLFGKILSASLFILLSTNVFADEAKDVAVIRAALSAVSPQAKADSIKPSVLPGMYEATFGPQVIYVSSDGRYMFEGDLYDIKNRVNLTEVNRQDGRVQIMKDIDPKTMIIYKAENPKHVLNVFTDIDCGYCRKLHSQIAEYNKLGIEIRYLSYPRSGIDTPSYYKAVNVWCSDDRQTAITEAKAGKELPKKSCDNPVKEHMAAARAVGVTGTPSLILENGRMLPGYVEPKRLLQMLDDLKKG